MVVAVGCPIKSIPTSYHADLLGVKIRLWHYDKLEPVRGFEPQTYRLGNGCS